MRLLLRHSESLPGASAAPKAAAPQPTTGKRTLFRTLPNAHVAILLASCQGEAHLAQQLDSLEAQTHYDWSLWVSDDGSRDGTLALLRRYRQAWAHRLEILPGPQQGHVRNQLSLLRWTHVQADYYAYAEQDDIWHADKLERALEWLTRQPADQPALYCGRARLLDERGEVGGLSPPCRRAPGFANALVQSLAGSNTLVFNAAARNVLYRAGTNLDLASHEGWIYLLICAVGGRVHHDATPCVDSRQARAATVSGAAADAEHLQRLGAGVVAISAENREILRRFMRARHGMLLSRVWYAWRAGLYRQSWRGNLALIWGIVRNRW